ncbi:unnamed protein product [Pleuronectes platessa]|uniref:CASAMP N-terminal domain-containing protein n=1 Tax=Pleuronectes platessa TaxID=8262 RepID=A0A9N7V7T6_PLEPL|nr:unnamed protein product [Pleuronectes platessa]
MRSTQQKVREPQCGRKTATRHRGFDQERDTLERRLVSTQPHAEHDGRDARVSTDSTEWKWICFHAAFPVKPRETSPRPEEIQIPAVGCSDAALGSRDRHGIQSRVGNMGEVHRSFVAPAVKSFEHYDFSRAKICCSLTWLVARAYGTDSIPTDLKDPFYIDQYEQEHLKPPVTSLLLSADLYCRAGSLILKSDASKPLLGHEAVIQALAQRGLYITDQERLVTERDLRKRPLQMVGCKSGGASAYIGNKEEPKQQGGRENPSKYFLSSQASVKSQPVCDA